MRSSAGFLILAALADLSSVVSAMRWKDSISRQSTDLLRKKHLRQQDEKFLTILNRVKPGLKKDPSENPLFVELPMDHFGSDNKDTISSRYYVQDSYYKPGGPVIFHDVGESSIGPYIKGLVDEDDFTVSMAKRFNGLLILFEHRFYGQSAPITDVSKDLSEASKKDLQKFYKYLTIEQALEDVVYFATNFEYDLEDYPKQDLTPKKTPWVWIGVSYSGARGAWLAKRNPGLFRATLASSAPVQLKVEFWEYFTAIEDNLAVNNKNCSADLHAAATWMSEAWESRDHTLVDQFIDAVYDKDWEEVMQDNNPDSNPVWEVRKDYLQDAAWTPFADFQYSGVNGGPLGRFCDILETAYDDVGPKGVFAEKSLEEAVSAYARAVAAISPYSYSSGAKQKASKKASMNTLQQKRQFTTEDSLDNDLDDYSWLWQVCTEFGAFQVSNTSRPENLLPSFINVGENIQQCIETFGKSDQISKAGPNVDPINEKYGGWNAQLSNTVWTNGEFDPWKALSIDSEEDDAPKDDKATLEIPKCGKTLPKGTQVRYIIKNGYHGSEFAEDVVGETSGDLDGISPSNTIKSLIRTRTNTRSTMATGTPVPDAANAHSLWFSAMSSWLPCTTLVFNEEAPETTSSAPYTSRTPYQTEDSKNPQKTEGSSESGNKQNAAPSLMIPSLLIPFFVSIVAFLAGIRVVV